ncbi:MAG: glycosyltransferase family 4 protein [Candidatus Geothermincolia bacterium]
MGKILILGHAPLPWEDLTKSYGPGTRTWQFALPLLNDGHDVTILASRIPFVYPDDVDPFERTEEQGCVICRATQPAFEIGGVTDELVTELDPDCIIGATAYPSYVGATYAAERPLWADIFGSYLAEAQAKAGVYGDDSFIDHFLRVNNHILLMADRFSTVSRRQSYELVGQLGSTGRLNSKTLGYEFASSIPCGVVERDFGEPAYPGEGLGPDDFIVLWSGGFNTWTDVRTLFEGLELAMTGSPDIHFVSTGAEIEGHDDRTYADFKKMVGGSVHRGRYHLKGWVKRSEAMSYYGTASVGINIDASHYEVTFGSRNRILEWALGGLPAVSTDLCELTSELSSEGLLFTIPTTDPRALAGRLLDLEADRPRLASVAGRLKKHVLDTYSFEKTAQPLREWAASPTHAPDFGDRRALRLEALQAARKAFAPPITPESPFSEKLAFYLKNEGLGRTIKRAAGKMSGRED